MVTKKRSMRQELEEEAAQREAEDQTVEDTNRSEEYSEE